MSPLIAVAEHIAQARQMDDGLPTLPWSSFADFFKSSVYDRALVDRPLLQISPCSIFEPEGQRPPPTPMRGQVDGDAC